MKTLHNILFTLLFCALFTGCNQTNKASKNDCIKRVIAIDDSLCTIRNHACKKISLSQTITNYAFQVESIDFSKCPTDFTAAFKKHIDAWRNIKTVTNKYPNLRGEMHDLFDSIEKGTNREEFKPLLDSIWSTWAEIETSIKIHTKANKT